MTSPFKLRAFPPLNASHAELAEMHRFNNVVRAELDSDVLPHSLAATIQNYRSYGAFTDIDIYLWTIWKDAEVVATAGAEIMHRPENPHAMQLSPIRVLAEHRRQRLGTALLAEIIRLAEQNGKTLLLNTTDSRIPAGEAFATAVGAEKGGEAHAYELTLADVRRAQLQTWQEDARRRALAFEVGLWADGYLDAQLPQIAKVKEAMNTAPVGTIEVDYSKRVVTVAQVRDEAAYLRSSGWLRWTIYAKHQPSGDLAGFTELRWHPDRPAKLIQGETGVLPEYRGHGLGLWMKVAMLTRVLEALPLAQRIETSNADMNAPMLKINQTLGFMPKYQEAEWQARVSEVRAYLKHRGTL